jgi:hypothetical protein
VRTAFASSSVAIRLGNAFLASDDYHTHKRREVTPLVRATSLYASFSLCKVVFHLLRLLKDEPLPKLTGMRMGLLTTLSVVWVKLRVNPLIMNFKLGETGEVRYVGIF